jgi:drug/metabolite transporter (DMT)-like permease
MAHAYLLAVMHLNVALGLLLAAISTTLTNLAYTREHAAAAALPALSLRRPLQSLWLLLGDRGWVIGFAMESAGFASYAAALALAPLAVVQSIGAGGIGVLAYASAKLRGRRLGRRQSSGVAISVLGLVLLGVSLARNSGGGGEGSTAGILAWLGVSAALALLVLLIARRRGALAVAAGIAGGLLFSIGDFSTKLATHGGAHLAFIATVIIGYTLGTSLLQLGYQRGGALTVAGLATLFTNALPILAGAIVLSEPVPSGALGVARVIAFVAVTLGAVLLAAPDARARGPLADRPAGARTVAPAPQQR